MRFMLEGFQIVVLNFELLVEFITNWKPFFIFPSVILCNSKM